MSFHLQEKPAGILALKCAGLRRVFNGRIKSILTERFFVGRVVNHKQN
jgi:hypothetical protein